MHIWSGSGSVPCSVVADLRLWLRCVCGCGVLVCCNDRLGFLVLMCSWPLTSPLLLAVVLLGVGVLTSWQSSLARLERRRGRAFWSPARVVLDAYARGHSATRGHGGRMCSVVAKKEKGGGTAAPSVCVHGHSA